MGQYFCGSHCCFRDHGDYEVTDLRNWRRTIVGMGASDRGGRTCSAKCGHWCRSLVPCLKPDDPVWKQRATHLTGLMGDLWTGHNQRRFLQFKSIYFSVDRVDDTPARGFDTVYHTTAIQPSMLYWQRTGDPAIGALAREWLKVWVDAAARADNGKPAGILPSALHWPDGNVGIPGKPWWQPFPLAGNDAAYNWPGELRLMTGTLLLAWHMTGEDRYLEPIRSMAAICTAARDKAQGAEAGSEAWCAAQLAVPNHRSAGWPRAGGSLSDTLGKYRFLSNDKQYDKLLETDTTGYVKYRLKGDPTVLENDLLQNAEAFRSNWQAYTSEMR
ncbi:MAG: hypothetical protein EHM61_05800 [Acidobacteria bacterium]|nr:MAG: hypothetical protein EHM61_05800 [Acidobacteriota bacterium]